MLLPPPAAANFPWGKSDHVAVVGAFHDKDSDSGIPHTLHQSSASDMSAQDTTLGVELRSVLLLLSLRGLALLDLWPLLRTLAELALSGLTGFFLRGHRAKGGQD